VQVFYDQLATPLAATARRFRAKKGEFDPLQFDRYTAFHTTLQSFQELMVRVQEIRADIDLIGKDFQEGLEQLRQQLDGLREDITQSRLVPFRFLAERFVAPLQTLTQRYGKAVELVIVGKENPIDQVILEQLQTPLTHLIRNAFDHGIEPTRERLALGKPQTAQITLSAEVKGDRVTIAIADDGRGIDLAKVYQRGVQLGLCSPETNLSPEQIQAFLFAPGFSTAGEVTDLSGRGVGLDAVKQQVERLRGTIQLKSSWQQGTTFAITIPLTLSILPLLLCRCQQRTLAIPSNDIREIIALAEFCGSASAGDSIVWQERLVRLFSLTQLLPYPQPDFATQLHQKLGIVLQVQDELIVVAVDSLLGEKELVLKPFDPTVKVPAYVAGCTVLGTGEVVAVLSPSHFGELIEPKQQPATLPPPPDSSAQRVPTILVVDDSVGVRRMLDRLLTQSGYQVVQCRDGKEALEALNRRGDRYDLAISDLEMPRLDGFALLREIRAHSHWHSLPFAMLTSRENDQHRQRARQLGATAYFTKPFQPHELLNAIAALLTDTAAKETR
jgi:type IV pili sensor histidine kinase/response regulator